LITGLDRSPAEYKPSILYVKRRPRKPRPCIRHLFGYDIWMPNCPRFARYSFLLIACSAANLVCRIGAGPPMAQISGPLIHSANPNYFQDASGAVVILNGSQTWNTLQDWGTNGSLQTADFDAFVKFLTAHGHNFTLLWTTEMPKFCNLPTTAA